MFGNFSLFKPPFQGRSSVPTSFVSFFVFYIFSYLFLKTMGCFSGCLMSSSSIQKLFCGIYSVFKCSFDEFLGEKVVSPSYSSTILGLPQKQGFLKSGDSLEIFSELAFMGRAHISHFFFPLFVFLFSLCESLQL